MQFPTLMKLKLYFLITVFGIFQIVLLYLSRKPSADNKEINIYRMVTLDRSKFPLLNLQKRFEVEVFTYHKIRGLTM